MNRIEGNEISEIIEQYGKYIHAVVKKYLRNESDIDDVTQETMLKIAMNIQTFDHRSKLTTWIYSIARNAALDFCRKNGTIDVELMEESYADGMPIAGEHREEIELGFMGAVITVLSDSERQAFFIGEIFELGSKKGGEVLDITPENFRKRVSRSKKKLEQFRNEHCHSVTSEYGYSCDFNPHKAENANLLETTRELMMLKERLRQLPPATIRSMIFF